MEAFNSFIKDIKDSISSLKNEVKELKKVNKNLSQRLESLEEKTADKKEVKRLRLKVDHLKTDFTNGMKTMGENSEKVEDSCERLLRLQKMLSILHLSVQQRKDLEDVVKDLKSRNSGDDNCKCCHCKAQNEQAPQASGFGVTHDRSQKLSSNAKHIQKLSGSSKTQDSIPKRSGVVSPSPLSLVKQHPSQCRMSSDEAIKMKEAAKKDAEKSSEFTVYSSGVVLCKSFCVWISGYSGKLNDNLNPLKGVYTTPAAGNYKFVIGANPKAGCRLYLCSDKKYWREDVARQLGGGSTAGWAYVEWSCEENEQVWIEGQAEGDNVTSTIGFSGKMMV